MQVDINELLKKVNNDILRDWLSFKEKIFGVSFTKEYKKHNIYFDEICENILKNVPKQNQKFVKKLLDKLDKIIWIIFAIGMRSIIGMGFVMVLK